MDGLRVIGHQRHSSDSAGLRVTHAAQQARFLLTSAAKLVLLQQHKNEPHELAHRYASVVYAVENKFTGKRCMDDSGGYTMKWRRVNPKPWTVRCNSTVFGLGQENSSSVGCCAAGEPAKPPHSEDSFCGRGLEISLLSASPAGELRTVRQRTPEAVHGRSICSVNVWSVSTASGQGSKALLHPVVVQGAPLIEIIDGTDD